MGDWYVKQTIGLLPERAARQWGPREALAFQGRRWTFADLDARVDAVARGLLTLGIAPGDKVALWMVNRPEWIDAMFAIMKIGAVLVPVNTRFRTEDTAYVLAQSDAAAVLLEDFDNDLRAAETQQLGLDEGIFLLERMDHRRPVTDVRSAVIHEHLFFLGLGDEVADRNYILVLKPHRSPLDHMFRRYSPPTSYRAWLIWPSECVFTASINAANTFWRSRAVFWR